MSDFLCTKTIVNANIVVTMNIDYAELLKQYREKMFLLQRDFAAKLGISYTTVNRWETGKSVPTIKMKKKLYGFFKKAGLVE